MGLKGDTDMIRYESTDPWYVRHYNAVGCMVWAVMVVGITLGVFLL